jgi:hypothetical protein
MSHAAPSAADPADTAGPFPRSFAVARPCRATAPRTERHDVIPRPAPAPQNVAAEAAAWATVLVRRHLVHSMVGLPTGGWLVQYEPHGPVRLLNGPADVLGLAAAIQRRLRAARPESR